MNNIQISHRITWMPQAQHGNRYYADVHEHNTDITWMSMDTMWTLHRYYEDINWTPHIPYRYMNTIWIPHGHHTNSILTTYKYPTDFSWMTHEHNMNAI